MALRNVFQEVAYSKALLVTINVTVIIGIVASSFYFSNSATGFTAWLSSPPALSLLPAYDTVSHLTDQKVNISRLSNAHSEHVSPLGSGERNASALPDHDTVSILSNQNVNISQPSNARSLPVSAPGSRRGNARHIWEIPSRDEKMPPLQTFRLTKELVEQRVKDNVIVVTIGNYAFMDFILTWVKRLTDLGVYNLLVGAMDTKLLEALYWKGVPVYDMGSHMTTLDEGWGSPSFHKMGRERATLIDSMLPFGYELLMCDTDMVWLKNPLPYLAEHPEADVLTSSDQLVPTVVDDSLEVWQKASAIYNIGISHWRPTDSAKKFARAWKDMLLDDAGIWDQQGFNDLMRKKLGPSVDAESGLVYAFDGKLKLGILPASIFCSGHTFFVQAMYEKLRLEPYAVHTTFQLGRTEGKRHRLREAMLFYDPPEYYDTPGGGFLSFKLSISKSLLLDGDDNVESHFALINHQLKQIRTALAIASLLNRTLVMPPIWCRLESLWFPHPGIVPGSLTRPPFICPMDHVLEVRESWLDVQLCQGGHGNCFASNVTSRLGVLKFPKNSSEETFKAVFSSFKDVKVIKFSSVQDAFLGFTDKTRERKFRNRVKRYASRWCCLEQQSPNHIYYDMFWDEKPGWKPVPPQVTQDDLPPW